MLHQLYNEVEAGRAATAVPARPLSLEELKSDSGGDGMVIHHKLSTHLMDLLSKVRCRVTVNEPCELTLAPASRELRHRVRHASCRQEAEEVISTRCRT